MEFGAHLPQMTWGSEEPASIARLTDYARLANQLGLVWLTANDHVVYGRPWLDGQVALAAVLPAIGTMTSRRSLVTIGTAPSSSTRWAATNPAWSARSIAPHGLRAGFQKPSPMSVTSTPCAAH